VGAYKSGTSGRKTIVPPLSLKVFGSAGTVPTYSTPIAKSALPRCGFPESSETLI